MLHTNTFIKFSSIFGQEIVGQSLEGFRPCNAIILGQERVDDGGDWEGEGQIPKNEWKISWVYDCGNENPWADRTSDMWDTVSSLLVFLSKCCFVSSRNAGDRVWHRIVKTCFQDLYRGKFGTSASVLVNNPGFLEAWTSLEGRMRDLGFHSKYMIETSARETLKARRERELTSALGRAKMALQGFQGSNTTTRIKFDFL